jgi:hypothetical protein
VPYLHWNLIFKLLRNDDIFPFLKNQEVFKSRLENLVFVSVADL